MHRLAKFSFSILILFSLLSCQQETFVVENPEENALNSMSNLSDLVSFVTLNDGSVDNIIDNSSCLSIILPVNVIANGTELEISSTDDLKLIERIFDESAEDMDKIEIVFPIKVVLADFSEVVVNNLDELEDLSEDCIEEGEDFDIECLDFKYPISISLYDSASQNTNIIDIKNDEELNKFIGSLDNQIIFSFKYPISLILSDSTEVTVNSNEELEMLIDEYDDSCDEDDDFDYDDDDIDNSPFNNILLSSAWEVDKYFDDIDLTQEFAEMVFVFDEEERVIVQSPNSQSIGEWESYGDNGSIEMEMEFPNGPPLEYLEDHDWSITYYDSMLIEMERHNEDYLPVYLTFKAVEGPDSIIIGISDYIIDGKWMVAKFQINEVDATSEYADYLFDFNSDKTLTYASDNLVYEGEWEEVTEGDHKLALSVDTDNEIIKELNDNWYVQSYSSSRIEFLSEKELDSSTSVLVIEKIN